MEWIFTALLVVSVFFPVLHLLHSVPLFKCRSVQTNALNPVNGMSILIPCYNEKMILPVSIHHSKQVTRSKTEIFYINDGSTDGSMDLLSASLDLIPCRLNPTAKLLFAPVISCYQSRRFPHIFVIDKQNGGKADALNAGISFARYDLVITLDADSILSDTALPIVDATFQNKNVVAAGGMVHVLQTKDKYAPGKLDVKKTNWLIRAQMFDLMKAFYVTKVSLAQFRALSIISGAFGVFRKDVLETVGGYRKTIGEDIDITLRIQQYVSDQPDKQLVFLPEAVCYTELPENGRDVFKQRVRWQKAFIDCLIHFAPFFVRTFFRKPVSFFCIFETFIGGTLAAYAVSLIVIQQAYYAPASFLDHVLFYFIVTSMFGLVYDTAALLLSRYYGICFHKTDWTAVLAGILFDVMVFRYLNMLYVMYGSIAYFFNRHSWNKVNRTGRRYETVSTARERSV